MYVLWGQFVSEIILVAIVIKAYYGHVRTISILRSSLEGTVCGIPAHQHGCVLSPTRLFNSLYRTGNLRCIAALPARPTVESCQGPNINFFLAHKTDELHYLN